MLRPHDAYEKKNVNISHHVLSNVHVPFTLFFIIQFF